MNCGYLHDMPPRNIVSDLRIILSSWYKNLYYKKDSKYRSKRKLAKMQEPGQHMAWLYTSQIPPYSNRSGVVLIDIGFPGWKNIWADNFVGVINNSNFIHLPMPQPEK